MLLPLRQLLPLCAARGLPTAATFRAPCPTRRPSLPPGIAPTKQATFILCVLVKVTPGPLVPTVQQLALTQRSSLDLLLPRVAHPPSPPLAPTPSLTPALLASPAPSCPTSSGNPARLPCPAPLCLRSLPLRLGALTHRLCPLPLCVRPLSLTLTCSVQPPMLTPRQLSRLRP